MGLATGTHGVKEWLLRTAPYAFTYCNSLQDIASCNPDTSSASALVVDANIMMMSVPNTCKTYFEYESLIFESVSRMLNSYTTVVLCFDEPLSVPLAKLEEQRARDAVHSNIKHKSREKSQLVQCSEDTERRPYLQIDNDCYDMDMLKRVPDCHMLMFTREARMRFIDTVAVNVYNMLLERGILVATDQQRCRQKGDRVLVLDGIDTRGVDRPANEARRPEAWGNDSDTSTWLSRSQPIGESDLKLASVDMCLRQNTHHRHGLIVWNTTDVDNIPIGMLHYRKVVTMAQTGTTKDVTVIAMKQSRATVQKRMREIASSGAPVSSFQEQGVCFGNYLVVDIAGICECFDIHTDLSSSSFAWNEVIPGITCMFALGGCDFVSKTVRQLKADMLIDTVLRMLKSKKHQKVLSVFLERRDPVSSINFMRSVCENAAEYMVHRSPSTKNVMKDAKFLSNVPESLLLRAAWTSLYWDSNGPPPAEIDQWGF